MITSRSVLLVKRSIVKPPQIGVASHAAKSRVIGLHNSGTVKVNIKGSWSRVMVITKRLSSAVGRTCLGS